jgi:hypothetical protein
MMFGAKKNVYFLAGPPSRAWTDHSGLALRPEKSLSYPKIADEVIESNLLGEEEKCPANLRVNEKR